MHIWYLETWEKYIDLTKENHRSGLRMRFDKGVEIPVREFCKDFAKWLRKEFFFPIRVVVYIKEDYRIRARDGDRVVGTFLWPADYNTEPYAKIATGDYQELIEKKGEEEAMWAILGCIAHELTHYFQYVNGITLTKTGEERQATRYSYYILEDYNDYIENGKHVKEKKDIWRSCNWEKNSNLTGKDQRTGLRIRVDKAIDDETRKGCKAFMKFLREEYFFPMEVLVCIKNSRQSISEKKVNGAFWKEDDFSIKPYIHVTVTNYAELCSDWGKDRVLSSILITIAYELTHYFQWINGLQLTPVGQKRQATKYARRIYNEYMSYINMLPK